LAFDTVFEADDDFQAFTRDGDAATGPGVEDMKGGNTVIVYALKALQAVGLLDDIPLIVAYTGEEEKPGTPLSISRKELIEAGEWADIGLGFESAVSYDDSDWGTVARRSSSEWILTVEGKQAHSSGIFGEDVGAGAIFEAARILDTFYEEVRGEEHTLTTSRKRTGAQRSARLTSFPASWSSMAAFARYRRTSSTGHTLPCGLSSKTACRIRMQP
jgi:glutamate carboxypeptidase